MLNSKQIGNITEVEIMLAFLKKGCNVLTPYGDCEKYDFVVDVNKHFYRIQCKTSHSSDNGKTFQISCRSSHRVQGKCKNEQYSENDIDFFATTYNQKVYLIPVQECGRAKKLRLEPTSNCQLDRVSFAENYELDKVIKSL